MIFYIIAAIVSLLLLVAFHELGHLLVARWCGVKVEEFGIGLPPRIFGRKIGETVYSLNLLPIGAFVSLYGEDKKVKDERSFSEKSVLQRALILLGGVVAFWVVAFILLTVVAKMGVLTPVADEVPSPDAKVIILAMEEGYPAQTAGLLPGDILLELNSENEAVSVNKRSDLIGFIERNSEFLLTVERNGDRQEIEIASDGPIGVYLERVENKSYSWLQAPIQGAIMTGNVTFNVVYFLGTSAKRLIFGEDLPPGVQVAGPVGIVRDFFVGAMKRGVADYLQILAMVSISLAVFNLIPIPALDGGRLLFLLIEKIKGSPVSEKVEQRLVTVSFMMLIGLFCLVTFYDIWG